MGAALRTDPTAIRIGPLGDTCVCPLAKLVRRRLRQRGVPLDFPCVYSVEPVDVAHVQADAEEDDGEEDDYQRGRKRRKLGSLPTMTGIFGLAVANVVLETLLGELFPGPQSQ